MKTVHFNRENKGLFTKISNRISYNQVSLQKYIQQPFSKVAFESQAELKSLNYKSENRSILVKALTEDYKKVELNDLVKTNIQSLLEKNTFTITTGHQLSIFTGPIYFIYKILHTIRLTEELNKMYPEKNFIPVFWMASEDHDFEEIQSVTLFNKTIKWETEQNGPVGRFKLDSFDEIRTEFKELFTNHPESEVIDLLNKYDGKNLGEATFNLVHHLFKKYGLVIVDGDNELLKNAFSHTLKQEITTKFSFKEVIKTNTELVKEEVKLQITPREINLFFIEDNLRSRIEIHEEGYFIKEKGFYSQEELLKLLENNPSSFSPNVVLRPLYQETILPNLCYLGGGGEMAYWLQLKGIFDKTTTLFPLIQVRNSLLNIDSNSSKKMDKIGLSIQDFFIPTEELKKKYVLDNSSDELNFSEINSSFKVFCDSIIKQTLQLDSNLKSFSNAEISRLEKQLTSIKQKLIKTEKSKHEQALQQIDQLKTKLFPNGTLQERSINFFSLCADGEVYKHLDEIYNAIDAFGNDLIVIER